MALIDVTKRPDPAVFTPTTVFLRLPKEAELQPGRSYAIQSGVTGTITYKGVDYPLTPGATRIDASLAGLVVTKLQSGLKFTVANSDQSWGVGAGLTLINLSGSSLIVPYVCIGVGTTIPTEIPEGQCYITSGLSTLAPPWTIIYRLNGVDQYVPLQQGAKFLKSNGEWWRFDGARETKDFEPVFVGWLIDKPLDLTKITNESLQEAMSADDDGQRPRIASPLWVVLGLLTAQKDKRENGPYIIVPSNPQGAARINPYDAGNTIIEHTSIIQIRRGQYRGQMFAPFATADVPKTGTTLEARIVLGTTPHDWISISASELLERRLTTQIADAEAAITQLQADVKKIAFVEADKAALDALTTAKDELNKAIATKADADAVKVSVEALAADIAALELAKADKTSVEASNKAIADLTALLKTNDATDADIQAALTKAEEAIADLKKAIASNPSSGKRTVYTKAIVINALAEDDIQIDGEGDIQMPTAPPDGAEVALFDPHRKIKAGKNNVLLGNGDRWLLTDGTYDTTPLTFTDNELLGGSLLLKYSTPTKSWAGYPTYANSGQAGGGAIRTGLKPARFTGDTVMTADPFDTIHLKGTGNIQIGTFAEGEFFEVQWDGVHDVQVLRPTGFTIHGADDDLQIDTAQMSVRGIRLTLEGINFEVT